MINWLDMIIAKVTQSKISAAELSDLIKSDRAGAIVTFSGDVRNHDQDRPVATLLYEVHPSAQSVIEKISKEVAAKYEIESVAVAHRFGAIPIGESAFVVAVSAAHRAPALKCCEELVERVKVELPIWKFQTFTDGSSEWVNSA